MAGRDAAERLPSWLGSIRFRLTAIYSLLLFGLAAMVVGGLYGLLARDLDEEPVSRTYLVSQPVLTQQGLGFREQTVRAEFQSLEHLVNQRALDQLRNYSFAALSLLFFASLGVGWFVAGRVLAPIGRITGVARQIQATDLSRRIALEGPHDELRDLADTFDGMLDRIEDAFDAQRRFIQDASHELRNPLAVMRTNLDVALADDDASVDDLRHTATVVGRTAERMSRLVDDLLVSARSGITKDKWDRFDLRMVADETVDEFQATAEAWGITLTVAPLNADGDVPPSSPPIVADRTAIKQALANLVGNAVRLAPSGSAVVVGYGKDNGWACLSVADHGPGLTLEEREHVFERFWRGDGQADRDGERRSGLGLAIVKDIAERHGGRVDVAARPGEGSTFVIWLPTAE